MEPAFRISQRTQAEGYFRTAALRKEAVFLSYSGKDSDAATRISAALRKKFEDVFDYKDGKSIPARRRRAQGDLRQALEIGDSRSIGVERLRGERQLRARGPGDRCVARRQEDAAVSPQSRPAFTERIIEGKAVVVASAQNLSYADVHHDPEALVRRIVELIDAPK